VGKPPGPRPATACRPLALADRAGRVGAAGAGRPLAGLLQAPEGGQPGRTRTRPPGRGRFGAARMWGWLASYKAIALSSFRHPGLAQVFDDPLARLQVSWIVAWGACAVTADVEAGIEGKPCLDLDSLFIESP
jgi:hypothetical protein